MFLLDFPFSSAILSSFLGQIIWIVLFFDLLVLDWIRLSVTLRAPIILSLASGSHRRHHRRPNVEEDRMEIANEPNQEIVGWFLFVCFFFFLALTLFSQQFPFLIKFTIGRFQQYRSDWNKSMRGSQISHSKSYLNLCDYLAHSITLRLRLRSLRQ